MVQDRATVTTADQYKVVYDLSIGTISKISMTLSTSNPDFKVMPTFDAEYLTNG